MENVFDPTEKRTLYGVVFVLCSMIMAVIDLALFRAIISATKNGSDMTAVLATSFCVLLFMVMASVVVTFQSFPIKVFSVQLAITGYFALLVTLGIPSASDHSRYSAMCIGSVVLATALGMILDCAWGRSYIPIKPDDEDKATEDSKGDLPMYTVENSIQEAEHIRALFRAKVITQQECEDRLNAVRTKLGLAPRQNFDLGNRGSGPMSSVLK